MKKMFLLLVAVVAITLTSCTENQRVKTYGGTGQITLPQGQKLIVATWKESDLWYLTRPMRSDEQAETYQFKEESSFGIMEGTYIIKEVK